MKQGNVWAVISRTVGTTVTLIAILMWASGTVSAGTEKVLYSFTGTAGGSEPHQGLVFDPAGNLYGTTFIGGLYGYGSVFKLAPNPDGSWTETLLHSFTGRWDGGLVDWGRLIIDSAGNLYGVTYEGGTHGAGVLYRLSPNADGSWTETVLHQFTGGKDGGWSRTTPFFDAAGNLYGTAAYGGVYGCGTAFKMTPGPDNKWAFQVIHQFRGQPACSPWVDLVPDAAGNLWGTTRNTVGGCSNPPQDCGNIFRLSPGLNNTWTYRVMHQFSGGKGGSDPSIAGLIFDDHGDLFGTTEHGGLYDAGTFFKMSLNSSGQWVFRVLHQFVADTDGIYPDGHLARDAAGNIYGTAALGGANAAGTLYRMALNSNGTWTFGVVYAFGDGDGISSMGGIILDAAGNLYGTTAAGGDYGMGTIYEITP